MGHYIKALKLAPRTPTAAVCHTNLGSSLYKLVRGVAAVCVCGCVAFTGTWVWQGRHDQAIKQFTNALSINPDHASGTGACCSCLR